MSEATQTQPQTLEATLNKTDFGHVLYENRKVFFAALIAVLISVTGYAIWKQTSHSSALETSVKVFEFQKGPWTAAKEGKATPQDLVKAFEGLDEKVQTSPAMIPLVLEMGKFLYEKNLLSEADAILSKSANIKEPVGAFFINLQRSVVLEKLGKIDEAISSLEKISGDAKNKEALLPGKVGVELGRLYLVKGEKGKAQSQFESVVSNYPNDPEAKLAKLYLSQITR